MRAGKEDAATWANWQMPWVRLIAGIVVVVLGVWGYFVPAIVRINISLTSRVLLVIFVMVTITPLTALLRCKNHHRDGVGKMPPRAGIHWFSTPLWSSLDDLDGYRDHLAGPW